MSLPTERNDPALTSKLGPDDLAALTLMLNSTDPLADAVIAELHALGPAASRTLHDGLLNGRASLTDIPPAIDALLEQVETLPAWIEPDILRRGSSAYLTIESLWNDIALAIGSLVHIYAAPAIAKVLGSTSDLVDPSSANHRLIETAVWVYSTMLPGGLARGARGYVGTIQVRLLHARIRAFNLQRGWDVGAWGIPINQADLARTWLDFTYTPYRALTKFGFDFTDGEVRDAYHLWQYLGYLLGIDASIYRNVSKRTDISTHADAEKLLVLLEASNKGPDDTSRRLVATMMTIMTQAIVTSLKTPFAMTSDISDGMLRFLHGDAVADQLGIAKSSLTAFMPMLAFANQTTRAVQRSIPAVWQHLGDEAVKTYTKLIDDNSATAEYRDRLRPAAASS